MRMLVRTERLLPVLFVSVVLGEPSPAWPLYPSGVAPFDLPGFYSNESVHHWPAGRVLFNVTNVTLTPYLVDASHPLYTGASVIVAPGGAYKWLTYDAEGTDIVAVLDGSLFTSNSSQLEDKGAVWLWFPAATCPAERATWSSNG